MAAREGGTFRDLADFSRRTGAERNEAESLILVGAMDGVPPGPHRRALLWQLAVGNRQDIPLALWRPGLRGLGYVDSRGLRRLPGGTTVRVAGLPVRPHRPPTRSGELIVYLSLEDECGLIDVTVREDLYQREGGILFGKAVPPLSP